MATTGLRHPATPPSRRPDGSATPPSTGARRPGRPGRGTAAGQVIAVEAAAFAVLAGWRLGPAAMAFAAPVALAVLLLALVRVRGRWAFEWALLGLRYALRRRVLTLPAGTPAA